MKVRESDVLSLLRSHGIEPVKVSVRPRRDQRPAILSVTLGDEGSADRLYKALRASTRLEIGQGRDEADRFVVTMFGAYRD